MERFLGILHRIEDGLLALILTAMVLLASGHIILRNLFEIGFTWADPLLRIMVLWLGLLGALAASRDNKHIAIDALSRFLPQRARDVTLVVTALFTAIVAGVVAYYAVEFVVLDLEAGVVAFAGLPAWVFELIIPLALALIALRYLTIAGQHLRALLARGSGP